MATNVKFTLPAAIDSGNGVSAHSAPLVLTLDDGSTTFGYMQKWMVDVNASHIEAKKGDTFFADNQDNVLTNVTAWEYFKQAATQPTE